MRLSHTAPTGPETVARLLPHVRHWCAMWLVSDFTPADIDDPQPGAVFAGRIEADHLGAPFKLGALLLLQILEPADPLSTGTLYILDDGSNVAIVRLQGESPDLWIVDRFSDDGTVHRSALARRRWHPRAAITVQ